MKNYMTTILIFLIMIGSAMAWEIDGSMVYEDDDRVYISVEPHTLSSSGWVEYNVMTKSYDGQVNIIFGFDSLSALPERAEFYSETMVAREVALTCDTSVQGRHWDNDFGIVTCYQEQYANDTNTDTSTIELWSHSYDRYDLAHDTIYYDVYEERGWVEVSDHFDKHEHSFEGMNTWYKADGIDLDPMENVRFRIWVDVEFGSSGKYDFGIYPSSYGNDFLGAYDDGNLYYLDPWWNTTFQHKIPIFIDNATGSYITGKIQYIELNTTSMIAQGMSSVCSDIRFVNRFENDTIPYTFVNYTSVDYGCDTGTTAIWVKTDVSNINQTIYAYYSGVNVSSDDNPGDFGIVQWFHADGTQNASGFHYESVNDKFSLFPRTAAGGTQPGILNEGPFGYALSFLSSKNDLYNYDWGEDYADAANGATFSIWIRDDDVSSNGWPNMAAQVRAADTGLQYQIYYNSVTIYDGTNKVITFSLPSGSSEYKNIVVRHHTNGTIDAWVNGVKKGSVYTTKKGQMSIELLGNQNPGSSRYCGCSLTEATLYEGAWSDDEIIEHFNQDAYDVKTAVEQEDLAQTSCSLLNITPSNISASSTGVFNAIVRCEDTDGINISRFILTGTIEGFDIIGSPNYWQLRFPSNNLSDYIAPYGNLLRAEGRNYGRWYDTGIFSDSFTYSVAGSDSPFVEITDYGTYADLNFTWSVEPSVFRSVLPLDRAYLELEPKKEYSICDENSIVSKYYDLENIRGVDDYTIKWFRNFNVSGTPDEPLRAFYCNSSYRINGWGLPDGISSVGLQALYSLNGSGIDTSGNARHLSVSGGVYSDGKIGQGLDFDGVNDYADSGTWSVSGDEITMTAWFKAETFGTDMRIISKGSSTATASQNWLMLLDDISSTQAYLSMRVRTGTTTTILTDNIVLSPGVWYHAAAVYDGAEMRLYINGIEVESAAKTGNLIVNTAPVWIGGQATTATDRAFNGIIDDAAIYSRALSDSEIYTIWENGVTEPDLSPHCVFLNSISAAQISDTIYSSANSSYSSTSYGVSGGVISSIQTTPTFYIHYDSDTNCSQGTYDIRYVNGSTSSDVSFAGAGLTWTSSDDENSFDVQNFTIDGWFSEIKGADQFQLGVYVQDLNGNNFSNFTLHTDNIGYINFPITNPAVAWYCDGAVMSCAVPDTSYTGQYSGMMTTKINTATDANLPGSVKHEHYIINSSGAYILVNSSIYSSNGDEYSFVNTSIYPDGQYKTNITATADDNATDIKTFQTINTFSICNYLPEIESIEINDTDISFDEHVVYAEYSLTSSSNHTMMYEWVVNGVSRESGDIQILGSANGTLVLENNFSPGDNITIYIQSESSTGCVTQKYFDFRIVGLKDEQLIANACPETTPETIVFAVLVAFSVIMILSSWVMGMNGIGMISSVGLIALSWVVTNCMGMFGWIFAGIGILMTMMFALRLR